MRGHQSIYKNLFDEPVADKTDTPQPSLRSLKTDCILDYYYFNGRKETTMNGKTVRMSYPTLLDVVGSAFFLSSITVHDIIQNNAERMALVKQEWKDRPVDQIQKSMVKKWPQFVW